MLCVWRRVERWRRRPRDGFSPLTPLAKQPLLAQTRFAHSLIRAAPRRAASARRVAFLLRGDPFSLDTPTRRERPARGPEVYLADAVRLSRLQPVAGFAGALLRSDSCSCSLQCCRQSSDILESTRETGRSLHVVPSSTSGGSAAACLRWRRLCLTTSAAVARASDRRPSCCCSPQRSFSQRGLPIASASIT